MNGESEMKPREMKKKKEPRKENCQNQVIKIKRKEYYLMKPRGREQSSEGEGETEISYAERMIMKKKHRTPEFRHQEDDEEKKFQRRA